MLRPTDREMIAIAKTVCYTCRSLKKDTLSHGGGAHGGVTRSASVRKQRERDTGQEALLWFLQEGTGKAEKAG